MWQCRGEKCTAEIEVRSSDNLVIAHHGAHTCGTSLKMEVTRQYGQLDGYTFHKDPGNTELET